MLLKNKFILILHTAILISLLSFINEDLCLASDNEECTLSVQIDSKEDPYNMVEELIAIDTESPYDADMSVSLGTAVKIRKYDSGKVELIQVNPIDVAEADRLLDEMQLEIKSNLKDDYNEKAALAQIIRYIRKNYSYDFSARTEKGNNKNFVDAFKTNKKIICTQYSALTYLLCNRFGIDCKIIAGNDHRYNAIRLSGEEEYTAYDLSKTTFFLPAKVSYLDLITTNYSLMLEKNSFSKAIGTALNRRISFHYSLTIEELLGIVLVLLITLSCVKITKKRA